MSIIASFVALPIPFLNSFPVFLALLWLVLFCGGFCLPPVTGIMINSVNQHHKSTANSIANLCYNLIGYLPAPSIYGLVSWLTDDDPKNK